MLALQLELDHDLGDNKMVVSGVSVTVSDLVVTSGGEALDWMTSAGGTLVSMVLLCGASVLVSSSDGEFALVTSVGVTLGFVGWLGGTLDLMVKLVWSLGFVRSQGRVAGSNTPNSEIN